MTNEFRVGEVTNVLGIIRGAVEPDRYVIVGSHRDGWGYGAVDPSTGMAAMVKVAVAFAETMRKYNWRPRRTIIFASWGAGEMGNLGSNEWVEENLVKLKDRAVAYVNVDACVSGPDLDAEASVSLKDVIKRAIKNVPDPADTKNTDRSYYDYWKEKSSANSFFQSGEPHIRDISSEGDHHAFAHVAGVPAINLRFVNGQHNMSSFDHSSTANFPTVNSQFDTFNLVSRILDPEFKYLETCARVLAQTVRQLSDSALLPHDFVGYADSMRNTMQGMRNLDLRKLNVSLEALDRSVQRFGLAARNWTQFVNETADKNDPISVRMVNDQIMQVEKIFLMPNGIPMHNSTKHALFATPTFSHTESSLATFPGIADLLYKLDKLSVEEQSRRKEALRKHVSDLTIMIHQATLHLSEFHVL